MPKQKIKTINTFIVCKDLNSLALDLKFSLVKTQRYLFFNLTFLYSSEDWMALMDLDVDNEVVTYCNILPLK